MELKEVIENRRSIRKYTNEDVPNELLEDLIECARLAPSAKNRQPWYFVVVRNKEKTVIADMLERWITTTDVKKYETALGYKSSVAGSSRVIREASVLILVFRKKEDNWIVGDNLSIGAAIENMILRATSLNLASLWIRDIKSIEQQVCDKIGLENFELNSGLVLGFAEEEPKMRPRKSLKEIMMYYEEK